MAEKKIVSNCDDCVHFCYDAENDEYYCDAELDEDEMVRFISGNNSSCPFYDRFDEYKLGRPKSGYNK